ncbi:2-C-methyl-D-erythritol 4-phosphate cytidylyltransferase [Allopseudospirillum japonicum]|uniref:2-C-methyl-D-erythritol 4-phosphate cytidylyltransferase n=1 Tax=Allopseudospirillum japonicum TaxID=64971 RepID=A0A1H6R667_9GAMM|nr:2-C-methyl-D-erythritol 4-phosphate cytidylyltransferase [Allopseudospirillum japonicum]SEI48017.1 2-C-methyl-D-erythritol 4-phosphate cytidylyltransferase [Allopseudospirillum japonicum]
MNTDAKLWILIPAAGIGQRMQADRPKQYLPLLGRTVLEQTLARLHTTFVEAPILLALHPQDTYWPQLAPQYADLTASGQLQAVIGGKARCDSVMCLLQALQGRAAAQDWVLVHDVARPCVRQQDLMGLYAFINDPQQGAFTSGALLGAPVRDTMKRTHTQDAKVMTTVAREQLWHAYTPQVFRYQPLYTSMQAAFAAGMQVTDEASAMEAAGHPVYLYAGAHDNLKITQAEDLALAAYILRAQQESE